LRPTTAGASTAATTAASTAAGSCDIN
jgi:hypothetical protein